MTQDNPPSSTPPKSPDTPLEAQPAVPAAQPAPEPQKATPQPSIATQPAPPVVPPAPVTSPAPPVEESAAKTEAAPAAPASAAPVDSAPVAAAAPDPCIEAPGKFALVVDDEPANRDFLVRLLEQAQLEVKGAVDAADALNKLANVSCARLIAIDHKLPDMDGVDLLAQLRTRYPRARLIMATMHDDRALMEKAFRNGCDVFLVKPHGFMELFRRVQLLDSNEDGMQRLIIDQYGPRPYRG